MELPGQSNRVVETKPAQAGVNEIDQELVSQRFLDRIDPGFARDRLIVSQGRENRSELIACAEPDALLAHNLSVRLGSPVEMRVAPAESIARVLDDLATRQSSSDSAHSDLLDLGIDAQDIESALRDADRDLLQTAGRAPVVRLVGALLFEALNLGASDVHVQPAQDAVLIRTRVDGTLLEARGLPRKLLEPIVSRVKVMASMDIAERRLPQDGRAIVSIGEHEVDLRVSTIPTALGERLVIRLLDKRATEMFELSRLGMPEDIRATFRGLCARPHGMVLVTGPTGSGKTTTLYSVLRGLNSHERNIMTLEDPIEYELPGISQSQINTKKGVTFATGLRHILRQDPDVIMVGEIRDSQAARTAVQSALTGHLVLSTLHTNSAAGAVVRLVDLGVEPYLINASVAAVLAQRLVRRVCEACGGNGDACAACRGTGMAGRIGVYELLVMDDALRQMLAEGASEAALQNHSRAAGMRTLRRSALELAGRGVTTRAEADRVTLLEEDPEEPG